MRSLTRLMQGGMVVVLAGCGVLLTARPVQAEAGMLSPVAERRVFAHYMTAYGASVEFYKREIELAQRHGVEGFALNCGEWLGSRYVASAERIYQAAKELDTDFKLFFSPDAAGLGQMGRHMVDMVERFHDHPNQFRQQGKVVISCWAGNPDRYESAIAAINEAGHEVVFVPYFFGNAYNWAMAWSPERVLDFIDREYVQGLYNFGIDATVNEVIEQNATGRRMTQYRDKLFMAGAGPTYNSANMRNMMGMEGYGHIWRGIIRDNADWVELVTWNDYNEDSNLMPFRWSYPREVEKDYYVRDETYLDVTGYYSAWFRTGAQPAITQDKVYFSYRNRSKYLTARWNPDSGEWGDVRFARWPVDQIHVDAKDIIYVTTFLTEPADLVVTLAGEEHVFAQPAGIAHARVALAAGLPEFALRRNEATLVSVAGRSRIVDEPTKHDSREGYHLINRTWTGGAVVGEVYRIDIDQTFAAVGDQFSYDLAGRIDANATYNVRIVYANGEDRPARLTLVSDGVMDDDYYIPAFLPQTDGDTRTVSFYWSLYEGATRLALEYRAIDSNHRNAQGPGVDDYGAATVEAIELVKLDAVQDPEPVDRSVPELVWIPGGAFAMGSEDGEPDERPVRTVEVDGFAIGKYEVTNLQFEQFEPDHRRLRDGFSWRDHEPVIYVNWNAAAQYCNWLSELHGLTPAYAQERFTGKVSETFTHRWNDWVLVEGADGYRLPTEEQWEYVASGRGEGRTYPWGDEEPVPMKHGNFELGNALELKPVHRAQEAKGVTEVGSFPAGASRDGVMDMAGNVSEWTHNRYVPTGGDGGAKHGVREDGRLNEDRYRTIRGGSWGYYNYSQRVASRDFNSRNYPGYIYIGFRVALPEAGYTKLMAR